jgi:hypothetical protein
MVPQDLVAGHRADAQQREQRHLEFGQPGHGVSLSLLEDT